MRLALALLLVGWWLASRRGLSDVLADQTTRTALARALVAIVVLASACGRTPTAPTAPATCTPERAIRTDTTWFAWRDGHRTVAAIMYQCPAGR